MSENNSTHPTRKDHPFPVQEDKKDCKPSSDPKNTNIKEQKLNNDGPEIIPETTQHVPSLKKHVDDDMAEAKAKVRAEMRTGNVQKLPPATAGGVPKTMSDGSKGSSSFKDDNDMASKKGTDVDMTEAKAKVRAERKIGSVQKLPPAEGHVAKRMGDGSKGSSYSKDDQDMVKAKAAAGRKPMVQKDQLPVNALFTKQREEEKVEEGLEKVTNSGVDLKSVDAALDSARQGIAQQNKERRKMRGEENTSNELDLVDLEANVPVHDEVLPGAFAVGGTRNVSVDACQSSFASMTYDEDKDLTTVAANNHDTASEEKLGAGAFDDGAYMVEATVVKPKDEELTFSVVAVPDQGSWFSRNKKLVGCAAVGLMALVSAVSIMATLLTLGKDNSVKSSDSAEVDSVGSIEGNETKIPTIAPTVNPSNVPTSHPTSAPTGSPIQPFDRDEFDPSCSLVSYVDHNNCGPRGDDAKANLTQCPAGHEVYYDIFEDWAYVASVNGCNYFAYTVYRCIDEPSTETGRYTCGPLTPPPTVSPTTSAAPSQFADTYEAANFTSIGAGKCTDSSGKIYNHGEIQWWNTPLVFNATLDWCGKYCFSYDTTNLVGLFFSSAKCACAYGGGMIPDGWSYSQKLWLPDLAPVAPVTDTEANTGEDWQCYARELE